MAGFCLATGIAPSEYLELDGFQIEAFAEAVKRTGKQ